MRVAVVGIGGVGGYFGSKLAYRFGPRSGNEVLFYCRGAHLEAIRTRGLMLRAREGDFAVWPALATDDARQLGVVDVALFTVKGYSLTEAACAVRDSIAASTVVVPLGNGVDNDETLKRALGRGRVLNGCVYISSHIESPGVVEQTGGSLKLLFGSPQGESEPYRGIEAMLREAGIDALVTDHIQREVWRKFIFIDAISGVTSLHGVTVGAVLATPCLRDTLVGLMREVESLAEAMQVGLPVDAVEQALRQAGTFPPDTRTSMQLDVASGARTEVDTMLGYVVRQGRLLGIPTPYHESVYRALSHGVGGERRD